MKSKISFFLPSFNIGGVERVFINYANALSDKGYNVDIGSFFSIKTSSNNNLTA